MRGVGADAPFDDAPFVQTWGRPATEDYRFFLNGGVPLSDTADAYFHANHASTEGLGIEDRLPQGFTPFFDGDHRDYSIVTGIRGDAGGLGHDFSVGHGEDTLDFFLNNTVNPDVGLGPDPGTVQPAEDHHHLRQRHRPADRVGHGAAGPSLRPRRRRSAPGGGAVGRPSNSATTSTTTRDWRAAARTRSTSIPT